jgi:hypothetical protein
MAGHRRKRMVLDGDQCTALTLQRFDVGFRDLRDAQAALFAARQKLDWHRLDAHHLADQRSEHGQMAAGLTGKDRAQRLLLIAAGPVIQIQRDLPFCLHHVSGRRGEQRDVQPVQLHRTEIAFVDMPSE